MEPKHEELDMLFLKGWIFFFLFFSLEIIGVLKNLRWTMVIFSRSNSHGLQ